VEQVLRFITEGGPDPYPSLADTIGSRIALLPQAARTVLQALALSGGEAELSLFEEAEVDADPDSLRLLTEYGFTVMASGRVRMVHPLFSDVAYEGIPEEARRRLHARFWSALEARNAEPAVLGRHAYEAQDRRAVPILERAGERAGRQFDDAGAAVHYRHAVELQRWALMEGVPEAEESFVRLSVRLGEALRFTADMVGADGVLREALGFAQGQASTEARVRLSLGKLAIAWEQFDRAERELRSALRIAFKAGDAALLAELYLEFGSLCVQRGDLEAGIDELAEGINLCTGGEGAEAEVGPDVLWRLVARQAETLQQASDSPAALAVAKHALRHARRVRSLVGEARVNALLAQLYETAGDVKLAMDHRAHALQLMRRLGDRRSTAELLIADAATIMRRGGVRRDTLMRLQEASQLAAQVGWQEGVVQSEQAIRDSEPVDAAASTSVKSGSQSGAQKHVR
jgi:tetratricopeptide (TPR) repeat protein